MGSYIQMGHHSRNLLEEPELDNFAGAILSPVNETQGSIISQIRDFQDDEFELIFDPQLYYPNSDRGHLPEWDYFPGDFDTADYASKAWWDRLNDSLIDLSEKINPSAICTPAFVPKNFTDTYYEMNNWIGANIREKANDKDLDFLLTTLVRLSDLTEENRSAEIASLVTSSEFDRNYLVLLSNTEPRRELSDTEELKGAMRLIKYLSNSNMNILIGFCSSDQLLWKVAGATNCATGKYFNLRRFTPSRWEPPAKGGGQLPYWFEESIMAYLREPDLKRLNEFRELDQNNSRNPFGKEILKLIDKGEGEPWLALSWKQYLFWFEDFERRFNKNKIVPKQLLRNAEEVWRDLDDNDVLFDEVHNDGTWIRRWRKAIVEFNKE